MRKPQPWSEAIKADDEKRGIDLDLDDADDELFSMPILLSPHSFEANTYLQYMLYTTIQYIHSYDIPLWADDG